MVLFKRCDRSYYRKNRQVPGLSQCNLKSSSTEDSTAEEYDGLDDILAARLKRRCRRDTQVCHKATGEKNFQDPGDSINPAVDTTQSGVSHKVTNGPNEFVDLVDCSSLSGSSDIEDTTSMVEREKEEATHLPSSSAVPVSSKKPSKGGKPAKPKRKPRGGGRRR
jgi:hypothetical protein